MLPFARSRRRYAATCLPFVLGLVTLTARGADRAGLATPLPDFRVEAADGGPFSLQGLTGKKAVVLAFIGIDCPNASVYIPRLIELSRTYESKGVAFVAVHSNAEETAEAIVAHSRQYGIPFPSLKDRDNAIANLVRAERTPEMVVLDGRFVLSYRGAIDDQYGQGVRKPRPTVNYLTDALDALIAGRAIPIVSTTAVGCPIERSRPMPESSAPAAPKAVRVRPADRAIVAALGEIEGRDEATRPGTVTYAADIAPIVAEKCQACHRAGQVGPFPLLTYDDARRHSTAIAEVIEDRRMPPWHADPRHGHFANDRSLTPKQRANLLAWVQQGSPLGDPAKLPPARSFPESWSIGKPDLIVDVPKPFEVPSTGVVGYIHVEIPSKFDKTSWIQAVEILPSERSVVHHVLVYVRPPQARGRGRMEHLAAYVPGDTATIYPAGIAKMVPAGSTLVFQIHYTPDGTPRTDRTRLGLIFASEPVEHAARTMFVENKDFKIPANDANAEVKSTYTVRADAHLFSLSPHMHMRGKDFKYTATFPDGRSEVLLSVPAYDFGWQSAYVLDKPLAIPKGTRIDCVAHFDNSSANPANPDSTKVVRWGEQSFQEMMMGYLDYVEDAKADYKP